MNENTTTYTTATAQRWHKLILCAGLLAALGVEECTLGLVSIESPADGTTFTEAQTVTITATALEGEGLTVQEVRFYRDDALAGTDRTAPYTHAWPITGSDNGAHRFHAEARYRRTDGTTELLRTEEVVYEVAIDAAATPVGVLGTIAGVSGSNPVMAVDEPGELAVVASSTGVTIVDVSDRRRPRIRSSLDLEGFEQTIAMMDDLAVVGTMVPVSGSLPRGGLVILDLANPDAPRVLSDTAVPSPVADVVTTGSLAFVASSRGVQIFSVADPRSPELLGSTDRALDSLALSNRGLIVLGANGFGLLDVSNPSDPTPKWAAGVQMGSMAVVGDRLYGIASGIYIEEFEVSASGPVFMGRTRAPTSRPVQDIEALSDRAFLASADGISVLDLRAGDRRVIGEIDIGPVYSLAIHEAGQILLAVDIAGSLSLISIRP